mgnify:CR=1 FL=1
MHLFEMIHICIGPYDNYKNITTVNTARLLNKTQMIAMNLYENVFSEYLFTTAKDDAHRPASHQDRLISANINN